MNVIETNNLTKYYGKIKGVEDLTFTVKKGEIFGFLGPNGAGKTTTIRTLLGYLQPTSGSATIFGKNIDEDIVEIKREVKKPIMMVGGVRSFHIAEEIIEKKEADFVSMCRPFIREPAIINQWKSGDYNRSKCISCNKCLEILFKGKTLHCVQQKNEKRI